MAISTQGQGRVISVPGAPETLPEATLPSFPLAPQLIAGGLGKPGGCGEGAAITEQGRLLSLSSPPMPGPFPQPHLASSMLAIPLHRWGN